MTDSRKNKMMAAATLGMFGALAIAAVWSGGEINRSGPRLQVRQEAGVVVLQWSHGIDAPMARRFADAYQAWKDQTDAFIIELNSPGGSVVEGKLALAEIEKMKATHEVTTRIGPRRTCASMCVPVYLAGEQRVAAADARFMFHEPAQYDYFTEEKARTPSFEQRRESEQFFVRYFENSPMTPAWRDKLKAEWKGKDLWFTAEELVEDDSGVVTAVE